MTTPGPTGNLYDKFATRNPIERRLITGFSRALNRSLPGRPTTVLEVGMGEGEVSAQLRTRYREASIVGVDLSDPARVDDWRERHPVGLFAHIRALPFPARVFDLILAIEVLEHVDDPPAALAEPARLGHGCFVLSVPRERVWRMANMARGKYFRALGNTPGHVRHWSRRGVADPVGSRCEVLYVRTPFPSTMVSARTR